LARRFISQRDRAEKRRLMPSSVSRRRSRERESGSETVRWSGPYLAATTLTQAIVPRRFAA
jgi:hypothetical protein